MINIMSILEQDPNWMTRLGELLPGWDGEDAEPPSPDSLIKAKGIVDWALQNHLLVESVDPDVLGGVGVYLHGFHKRTVWVCILNNRNTSVVFRDFEKVTSQIYNESSPENIKSFLLGE